MNIYELAKEAITEKRQWAGGESIVLFAGKTKTVKAKRDSVGQIRVYILIDEKSEKNTKLINTEWIAGFPGNFQSSSNDYQKWVNKVSGLL